MAPIASPFAWTSDNAQRRAHGLTDRATYAKLPPVQPKIVACSRCFCVHAGEC